MAYPAPGSMAPARPSSAALAEVRAVIDIQAAQVDRIDRESMRALIPSLLAARDEIRRELAAWLRDAPDGEERFTAQHLRRSMLAIDVALDRIRALGHVIDDQNADSTAAAAALSREHLVQQVARFGAAFGESVYPTDLEVAAAVASGKRALIPSYRTSAARYANGLYDDIARHLSISVNKNETWSQMKARLVKWGGPRGMVALRGVAGDPGAVVEDIAEGLFKRYRYWAERIVRTEMVSAYNLQHEAGIEALNEARDPKVTAEYVSRWDATLDKRACPVCRDLDRRVAKVGGLFKGGKEAPPAHPNCRCLIVAWHVSWGDIKGEVPAVVDATDPLPALPRTPERPQQAVKPKAAAGPPPASAPESLTNPRAAAVATSTDLIARGKFSDARGTIERDLEADGLTQTVTFHPSTGKINASARLKDNGVFRPRNGQITIRSDRAKAAQDFARGWRSDQSAVAASLRDAARFLEDGMDAARSLRAAGATAGIDGLRTMIHEIHHARGPAHWASYKGSGVFVEEVTTEWAARGYLRRSYGVPRKLFTSAAHPEVRIGSYRGWTTRLVDAVREVGGLSEDEAMDAVESAALAYKRRPSGTIRTGDEAVDTLASLLPGDVDEYKIRLRAIARRKAYDEPGR